MKVTEQQLRDTICFCEVAEKLAVALNLDGLAAYKRHWRTLLVSAISQSSRRRREAMLPMFVYLDAVAAVTELADAAPRHYTMLNDDFCVLHRLITCPGRGSLLAAEKPLLRQFVRRDGELIFTPVSLAAAAECAA